MAHDLRRRVSDENIALFGGATDAELIAVQVAIHLEEALGTTLSDHLIDAAHLGSWEAAAATVDLLLGPS